MKRKEQINYWAAPSLLNFLPKKIYKPVELMNKIGFALGVKIEELNAKCRKENINEARQIAMWFIRNYTNMTLQGIGEMFNRNHATVIHAIRVVNNQIQVDNCFKKKIMRIKKHL